MFLPGFGMRINGAHRWLNLFVTSFQPVEAVKLILVIYLSSYLVRHRDGVEWKLFGVIKPIGVAGLIVLLLLAQPDFGSAALVVATTVGMVWLAGARMRNLVLLGAPLMPALAWAAMTEDYRIKRLTSFLDPWKDPFNDGFQLTQALIAIGRGEWLGVGLGSSVQKLFYLPEAHTDFILAVLAEELGLAGICAVVALLAAGRSRPVPGPEGRRARPALRRLCRLRYLADDRLPGHGVHRREPRRAADQGPDAAADQLGRFERAADLRDGRCVDARHVRDRARRRRPPDGDADARKRSSPMPPIRWAVTA